MLIFNVEAIKLPTFTFAVPSGSFYVRLHAYNGLNRSVPSNEIPLHVKTPIAPPADLLALVNGSSLSLAWTNTHRGGPAARLILDVTGSPAESGPLPLGDSAASPVLPQGTYTLLVRAQNAAGGRSAATPSATIVVP